MSPLCLLGVVGLLGTSAAALAATPDDPLAPYHWTSRVLLSLARSSTDPALDQQRRLYHDMRSGARERDLVLVEVTDASPGAEALRRRFHAGYGFAAVLVGKDGGEKLRSATPLGAAELFPLIDSMPMRQDEMRKTGG